MKLRLIASLLLASFSVAFADPHPGDGSSGGATNKDGSFVTGIISPVFNPSAGAAGLPFPHNLQFTGTGDITLNTDGADPNDPFDPLNALSSMDGFSVTEKWTVSFVAGDPANGVAADIDPTSIIPGQSVRVFQVTTLPGNYGAVTGIVRELVPGLGGDYIAQSAPGGVLAIVPMKPLPEFSDFMVVLTDDIRDAAGNNATPSQTYFLSKSDTPWINADGSSASPFFSDASAQSLEGLRRLTATMEAAGEAAGIHREDVILAYTVHTQGVTPVLKYMRSIVQPNPVLAGPTGMNTGAVGGFGLADIFVGIITLPYYQGVPSAENPIAPLTDFWKATPGAYVPPFDQAGLDPTSTNITTANPFPVLTDMQTVPVLVTAPSAASGHTKPVGGWPVIVYIHGITRNRTDMLRIADSVAQAGFAFVAMDQPLHGVVPEVEPVIAPFYINNHPVFGSLANERTFDSDYWNNTTGALGPDGIPDPSGQSYFNVTNFRAVRDNLRQAQHDYSNLTASLQNFDLDNDGAPDLNPMNVGVLAHSLGVYTAAAFLSVEPLVTRAYFNAGGAQSLRTILSGSFGELINAALANLGILPGTAAYEQFVILGQTLLDSTDPAGWAADLNARGIPIIHNQVQGDLTVPNQVAGAPMGGNEGLNRLLGLQSYSTSQSNPDGLNGVARFIEGSHGSLLDPTASLAATQEMQGQLATFLGSNGTFVGVRNPTVLAPVADGFVGFVRDPSNDSTSKEKSKERPAPSDEELLQRLRDSRK